MSTATFTATCDSAALPSSSPGITIVNFPNTVEIVNGIVTPNLRVLLANTLGAIDASIPNKEQNRAVKHIIRAAFDEAYFDILRRAYPDSIFGNSGGYSVQPESDRSKAFAGGFLKQE